MTATDTSTIAAKVVKPGETPLSIKSSVYLVPSPIHGDGGHEIGRLPREISIADLRVLAGRSASPMRAIREKCIDCRRSSPTEARKCVAFRCALWPFRMGKNPFWGKADDDLAADHSDEPEAA